MELAPTTAEKPQKTETAPGTYPGIPFDAYQRIAGVNQSSLKDARSPAHIREAIEGDPDNPTAAMVLGSALHARLLEMTTAVELIVDGPINDKTGKCYGVGTKAWDEFVACNPGKIVLGSDQREQLDGMAESVMRHPLARQLIEAAGESELVLVWDEPAKVPTLPGGGKPRHDVLNVRCKARLDKFVRGTLAFDLKTTADASPVEWSNAVHNYGYHIQDDFYRRGMRARDMGDTPFGFLVVENVPPYGVVIYEIDEETRGWGKHAVDRALAMVAACQQAGAWPGYDERVTQIGLPLWALKRLEEGHGQDGGVA